jgi:GNAT superfamily N-acetyltransferase
MGSARAGEEGPTFMHTIVRLSSSAELLDAAKELAAVLVDAVEGGASVGFLAPLGLDVAAAWWEGLAPAVDDGRLVVWAARAGDGRIAGTVQLKQADLPNGHHRAEIAKLLVHRAARGQGLGRELLALAERAAADAGKTLLLLDTESGSPAERLYRAAGWTPFGVVPDHAVDPAGVLRPTTYFYKSLSRSPASP